MNVEDVENVRNIIPAVRHIDGTVRIQTRFVGARIRCVVRPNPVHGLPPTAQAAGKNCTHLQYLWPAHAPGRWLRGVELHHASAIARRRPDIALVRTAFEWEPAVGLNEGLQRSVEYFRHAGLPERESAPRPALDTEQVLGAGTRFACRWLITAVEGAIMRQFNGTFRTWMKRLSAALLLMLAACSQEGGFPKPPPQSPPRPTTMNFGGGHASIAVLYLKARPASPPPGWM